MLGEDAQYLGMNAVLEAHERVTDGAIARRAPNLEQPSGCVGVERFNWRISHSVDLLVT